MLCQCCSEAIEIELKKCQQFEPTKFHTQQQTFVIINTESNVQFQP